MTITREVTEELESIRDVHPEGRLLPADVLARATDSHSALHAHFTWNDDEAAEQWRLVQARQLIMHVKVSHATASGGVVRVRAYASLASDRLIGGGYRPLVQVLSDEQRRDELLRTAWQELAAFRERYRILAEELAPLFHAMDVTRGAA